MAKKIFTFIMLAVLALSYLFVFNRFEKERVVVTKTIITTDSIVVYVPQPPQIITKEIHVSDTIYITRSGDTTITEVAKIDTSFEDGAGLEVSYYLNPRIYEISYTPAPIKEKTIIKLETIYVDSSAWWDNFKIGVGAGLMGAVLLVSLVR